MKDFNDALLDISWNNFQFQYSRFRDIDTKAIAIITISGILIALLPSKISGNFLSNTFLIATFFLFVETIFLSIKAFTIRKYKVTNTRNVINDFRNKTHDRQIGGIIGSLADSEESVCYVNNKKVIELKKAIYLLASSITFLSLHMLFSIFGW